MFQDEGAASLQDKIESLITVLLSTNNSATLNDKTVVDVLRMKKQLKILTLRQNKLSLANKQLKLQLLLQKL